MGGVLHYLWLVKADVRRPIVFGLVLVTLLATRLWHPAKRGRRAEVAVRDAKTSLAESA